MKTAMIINIQALKIDKVFDRMRDGSTQLIVIQVAEEKVSKRGIMTGVRVVEMKDEIVQTHTG